MVRELMGMSITSPMLEALKLLRDAKKLEWPFIPLPGFHKLTVDALVRRRWVFASSGMDGVRYKITDAGERALRIFEKPSRRNPDKICPTCGIRPKHISASGRLNAYCTECERDLGRRKWQHNAPRFKSHTCPRCEKRPRHQYPNGKTATYCERCIRTTKRQNKKKNKQRKIEQARRGELICIRCKANPRHYTEKSVYDYCRDCLKVYMANYNDRRRPDSPAAKQRKG